MTITTKALRFNIALAAGTLTIVSLLSELWLMLILSSISGILWWFQVRKQRKWLSNVFLLWFAGMAAGIVHMGGNAAFMLVSVLAALSAWDLAHFSQQLHYVPEKDEKKKRAIEHAHLWRLLFVNGFGIVLAGGALMINFKMNFEITLFLTALAIICVSRFLTLFRRESD